MKFYAVSALGVLSAAATAATVDVHIDVTVTVATAVITNEFGFAVFPAESTHHRLSQGNADAISDSTPSAVSFGGSHSLYATGYALPDASILSFAHGDASSSQKFNLGNLTGTVVPKRGFSVDLAYTYSWSIDLQTGDGETALGTVSIDFAGTSLVSKSFFVGENDSVNERDQKSGVISVFLDASSVTSKFFTSSLTGDVTSAPMPVPEPATFAAFGLGIALVRRRRRA